MAYEINEALLGELREHVNTILAGTHLMGGSVEEQGQDKSRSCLATMNKSLYCILRIFSHLKPIEPETIPLCLVPLDISQFCQELGEQVESLTRDMGTEFRWKVENKMILTLGDKTLLTQAILNLLTDAFLAAGPGGHITLSCASKGDQCVITVSDDGPGPREVNPDANPLVKGSEGLGHGLINARRFADAHGGRIVQENLEHGVRTVLSFPIKEPDGSKVVKSPTVDIFGGFSPLLVEFAPLLPPETFFGQNLD